jgi:hypothetical protein
MSATLDKVKEEVKTLAPDELHEVRELVDALLTDPEAQPAPAEPIDCTRELQWLAEHRREYAGQWVALDRDRLLAHGANAREVYEAAHQTGSSLPLVVLVEAPDQPAFGGW